MTSADPSCTGLTSTSSTRPTVRFARHEELWDPYHKGVRKIWTCHKLDKRCPFEIKTGGLALNYLQTAYRIEKGGEQPPLPPPPAKRQKVKMEGRCADVNLMKLLPIMKKQAENLSVVAERMLHAEEELEYTAGGAAQKEIVDKLINEERAKYLTKTVGTLTGSMQKARASLYDDQ